MISEKSDEAVVVDILNRLGGCGVGLVANDWVIIRSDYDMSCLDTLGYVMPGNSRLARGYQDSVGTRHSHLQSRIVEKNIWKRVSFVF